MIVVLTWVRRHNTNTSNVLDWFLYTSWMLLQEWFRIDGIIIFNGDITRVNEKATYQLNIDNFNSIVTSNTLTRYSHKNVLKSMSPMPLEKVLMHVI